MAYRVKMDIANRAKQFAPFAALKGYEEALRAREKIVVPKVILSEEMQEELNRRLLSIEKNDMITVVYFCKDEYLQMTGMISRIDTCAKVLKVVETMIPFEDIYKIEGERFEKCIFN